MTAALPLGIMPLGIIGLAILLPLAREYSEFRRDWGLSRAGALLAAGTLFPALGVGLAVSLPLAERPTVQWAATIVVTIAAYSVVTSAFKPDAEPAPRRPA